MLCRADGLEKSMSHYLIERIDATGEHRGADAAAVVAAARATVTSRS